MVYLAVGGGGGEGTGDDDDDGLREETLSPAKHSGMSAVSAAFALVDGAGRWRFDTAGHNDK